MTAHLDHGGQQSFRNSSGLSGIRKGCFAKITEVSRTVQRSPSVLIIPLVFLGLLLGLGIWAVTKVIKTDEDSAKLRAASLAQDTALWYRQQLSMSSAPVSLLAAIVRYRPDFEDSREMFRALAPALLAQTPQNSVVNLHLAPNGVISDVYPLNGSEAALGFDVLASPADRDGAVKTALNGGTTYLSALQLFQWVLGVTVVEPIFVPAPAGENETWGIPWPLNPYCGEPCGYNATAGTKFWGYAAALVNVPYLASPGSRLFMLQQRGYLYEVLQPGTRAGTWERALSNTDGPLPEDAVEMTVPLLPTAQWVLRVYPMAGWSPSWFGGLVAGVVLIALALAGLMFAVLVSRHQHQALLNALLPKDVIRELRRDAATATSTTAEAHIMRAETPADLLLAMMADLLVGHAPDLRHVVFVRTALMRNMDVYQPLNLRSYLRGSSLDADVVKNLMQQLGNLRDMESTCGDIECGGEELDTSNDPRDGRNRGSGTAYSPCDTVAGAMQLLLSVQPIAVHQLGGGGVAEGVEATLLQLCGSRDIAQNSRDGDTGSGATSLNETGSMPQLPQTDQLTPLQVATSGIGRWRGTRRNSALALTCSNGRGHSPAPSAPQLTVPACLMEEAERLLAKADDWHFDSWALQEATQGHALSMLGFYLMQREGLAAHFRIRLTTLARLLRQIEAGYNDNPYHSATHAADVLQTLHVIVHTAGLTHHYLDPLGLMAAYYASIVHDYSHPGLTSDFLVATSDPLAIRYNDRSPLENHHCAASFALLQRPELNALAPLSQQERAAFRKQVIELVLATDMKQHFSILSHFNTVHRLAAYSQQQQQQQQSPPPQSPPPPNASSPVCNGAPRTMSMASSALPRSASMFANPSGMMDKAMSLRRTSPHPALTPAAPKPVDETERLLSLQMALKAADIGHLGEAFDAHKRWLTALEEEFFRQGDRERTLGLPISPLFDRSKQGVSKSQVGFYDFVALPLVHALSSAFPGAQPLMRCFLTNYNHWRVADGQLPVELPRSKLAPCVSSSSRAVVTNTQLSVPASTRAIGGTLRTNSRGAMGAPVPAVLEAANRLPPPPPPLSETCTPVVKLTLAQD